VPARLPDSSRARRDPRVDRHRGRGDGHGPSGDDMAAAAEGKRKVIHLDEPSRTSPAPAGWSSPADRRAPHGAPLAPKGTGPAAIILQPKCAARDGLRGARWELGPWFMLQSGTVLVAHRDGPALSGSIWAGQSACLIRKRSVVRIHVRPPVISRGIASPQSLASRRLQPFCNPSAWEGVEEHGSTRRRG